jgi:radical SAM superfamily enzyme YgiQ (UPF0313 family)
LVKGLSAPRIINGGVVSAEDVPMIRGPTIHGLVEISRGCGRGCDFCVPNLQRYRCLSIDHILREVEVNLRAGRQPLLHAEDVLRYKAKGFEVNKEAVTNLFATVKRYPGVKGLSISHFALSSVASAPDVIEEISGIIRVGEDTSWLGVQTGIETGSPKLMKIHMHGKCKPFAPEEWPDMVVNAFQILSENYWVPAATLIIGLPKEDEKDINLTIQLVERLQEFRSLIVPLFFVAEGTLAGRAESFTLEHMNQLHGELFVKCWKHNLRWMPTLLKEYSEICVKNGLKRYGLRLIGSLGIRYADSILNRCRDEYNYDLKRMIKDIKTGRITVAQPLQVMHRIQHIKV